MIRLAGSRLVDRGRLGMRVLGHIEFSYNSVLPEVWVSAFWFLAAMGSNFGLLPADASMMSRDILALMISGLSSTVA